MTQFSFSCRVIDVKCDLEENDVIADVYTRILMGDLYRKTKMLSDEQQEAFIELWHEHPRLYAVNSKSYSNKNENKKAADDIVKMAMSVDAVYKKITSLRKLPSSCSSWIKLLYAPCSSYSMIHDFYDNFFRQHFNQEEMPTNAAFFPSIHVVTVVNNPGNSQANPAVLLRQ